MRVPLDARLGADGEGLNIALATALPWFLVLSGAFSLGVLEAVTAEAGAHLSGARLEHLGEALIHQPIPRAEYARLRLITDRVRAFLSDTLSALEAGRPDAQLRVLEIKAMAAEDAAIGCDLAMRLCGGAAFRKETNIEPPSPRQPGRPGHGPHHRRSARLRGARRVRPAAAGARAVMGGDETLLMGAVAYDPKVVTIWDGFRRWFAERDFDFDYVLYSNYERQVEDLLAGRIHAAWNSPLAWVRARRLGEASGVGVSALTMRDTDQDLTTVVVVRTDSGITDPDGLRGQLVGVGAIDSPQATLLALHHLQRLGLDPARDLTGPPLRRRDRSSRRPHRR